jgi:hypothetical protein
MHCLPDNETLNATLGMKINKNRRQKYVEGRRGSL